MSDRPPRSRPPASKLAGDTLSFDFSSLPFPRKETEGEAPNELPSTRRRPAVLPDAETREEPASSSPPSFAPSAVPPAADAPATEQRKIYTVAQLGRIVGRSLERIFVDTLWVEGEVSGARPAPSGHVYFCLKDEAEEAVI